MKVIRKIFAVIFSIIYFFILTTLIAMSISLNLLSGNYYADIIKSVDLNELKIADLGNFFNDDEFDQNATVEDVLIEYFITSGVSEEIAIAVINNERIREVLGNFIGDYMNYRIGGKKPIISREDIEDIFNEPDVKELLEQSSENIDIDKIYNDLNELTDEIVKEENNNYDNTERNNINPILN